MDYSILIEGIIQSYTAQVELYKKLKIVVQKILGQIAISRGDFSSVMGLFEEKQKLLEKIEKERDNSKKSVEIWQKEKGSIPDSEQTARLDTILAEAEKVIKDFLEIEDQLKKYLEHNMNNKGNNINT